MKSYFVTGIGTGVGKTLISAILTEKLQADYWKPIQAGDLQQSDSLTLKNLISNSQTRFHPETYRLHTACSPHLAAEIDGIEIKKEWINLPITTNKNLIIEGAGGVMVPLNKQDLIIDLIEKLKVPVILVSKNYLGSINHTLLSINILKQRKIPIQGIIFNGDENASSQEYILNHSKIKRLGTVPHLERIDKASILACCQLLEF